MIVFETNTLIPLEAFTTFGVNAKPNSTNPIGQFGTGLKYAVAIALRLGGTFTLWRGQEQFVFYTKETDFRGTDVATVRMKSKKLLSKNWRYTQLPFTLALGKYWEPWMCIRELESNTRDEGGSSYVSIDGLLPNENKTLITIECEELEEAFLDLDTIFKPDTQFICDYDGVEVYRGQSNYIFYRGVRVTKLDKPSVYTYNIVNGFDLTEDRTDKYSWFTQDRITKAIISLTDLHKDVLTTKGTFESTLAFDTITTNATNGWYKSISVIGTNVALPRAVTAYNNYMIPEVINEFDVELTREEIENLLDDIVTDELKQKLQEILDYAENDD